MPLCQGSGCPKTPIFLCFAAAGGSYAWMSVKLWGTGMPWMMVEAAVSIGAGVLAGSALLTAFGIVDSVIELVSGAILLWRL